MGNLEAFFSRCQEACEEILRMQNPLVVHHYDCDGIASGSIAAWWLEQNGKQYRMVSVRKLDELFLSSIAGEPNLVFVDLGSGTPMVEELKSSIVIIDHHQPAFKSCLQANPHLFGFDGGHEISASGCAHFVFNSRADLGVVGAVGDIQYPLKSLNRIMLDKAVSSKQVAVSTDLRLFGRNSRPLIQFLSFSDDPYLPGLTGNEEACAKLLSELSISLKEGEKWRAYSDLSLEEKRRLVSALAEIVSQRISPEAASSLTGEVYSLLQQPQNTELSDASEFATLLNACGRNSQPQLGVDVCLSRQGAFESARLLLAEHRRRLREGIEFALKNVQDFGKFFLIDGRGAIPDSIIGVVSGMIFPGGKSKPVLGLSLEETGAIKLSARGTRKLVEEGLNLGKIMAEASSSVGGVGGGHNIAAGATIPADKLDAFVQEFARRL
ncbi:MAG: DHH family phosphoesterase [Candidatus Micrarchaeota archaeon]|nr:DHH family phosphoesterase [Candidatus Micrarchaeota archaeon]